MLSWIGSLPAKKRSQIISKLTVEDAESLWWDWRLWARANQLPPSGAWTVWLLLAGRGFGKTRAGAEWVRQQASGPPTRGALIAPTPADARDVMVEGESGLLNIGHPGERPTYEPSKRRLTWPNGTVATIYSGYDPDQLRGPQHHWAWCDELASWQYAVDAWDMLMFGLRLGEDPRCVITTTPKPLGLLRDLVQRDDVVVTRGSTYDNSENLAPSFFAEIVSRYEGTSLGQQELYAVLLEEAEGALWTRDLLTRTRRQELTGQQVRTVVAIDPAISRKASSNETGIIVASKTKDGHAWVRADVSGRYSPREWATKAIDAYGEYVADRIVVEDNQGGDMVEQTLRNVNPDIPIKRVHASDGKRTRAEPIVALYEQGRVHHIGVLPALEDQLCTWVPDSGDPSPDRLDALVWAVTELVGGQTVPRVPVAYMPKPNEWAVA